ncbi:MAG: 16S rRNA (cytosine(1402)-N(4))-methyltransferase RsmH [Kiritimatiellae bacterium]|nr:16S rRNA (cytosine(1402)-N(4))-methyltransferase RsmH [Kiritimatiellia bacterium]
MHVPVMVKEAVEMLAVRKNGIYVDGTVGAGGHARAVLERLGGAGMLIGLDRDADALELAACNLRPWLGHCRLLHGNFADIQSLVEGAGIRRVDGILLDLGMSAMQVERGERGFSFMKDGPLDMRMDRSRKLTAAQIVEETDEKELARIIREYGEEPAARRIARAIAIERRQKKPWTTRRLVQTIEFAARWSGGRIHPATRTFQALRITVNDELGALEKGLEGALALLAPAGRLTVISYHSLEDRLVKHFFKKHIGRWVSLPEGGESWQGMKPVVRPVTGKPRPASGAEIMRNPRARSAKMRCIERTE